MMYSYWEEPSVIAPPLLDRMEKLGVAELHDIIVEVNPDHPSGREVARELIGELIWHLVKAHRVHGQGVHSRKTDITRQYVFGRLRGDLIQELVRRDRELAVEEGRRPALYRVWPDLEVQLLTERTIATIGVDAARNAFGAFGRDILWAVIDSGIDAHHPHFLTHKNLELDSPLRHCDINTFGEGDEEESERAALTDENGHGTHVAGIIAGELASGERIAMEATGNFKDERGKVIQERRPLEAISGMAPACKLISFKVLDKNGKGPGSNLIVACERIQEINDNGHRVRIHGVNIGFGYEVDPIWFIGDQSPLCVEVNRLARSGVVVVVPAGNSGWKGSASIETSINDPGNAELAITVGSTHRDSPTVHGVSLFSSKGPTSDGRMKPDLVAPGEGVVSCQASGGYGVSVGPSVGADSAVTPNVLIASYIRRTGTSIAAAHVSGAAAALMSACQEYVGKPEKVKEILISTARDLDRAPNFQGHGLVDLMRAVSAVRTVGGQIAQELDTSHIRQERSAVRPDETSEPTDNPTPVRMFISYSHADEKLHVRLGKHLALLKRDGVINEWHDRRIDAGQEWAGAIDEHLNSAAIVLLLVSADFLASDYCYDNEMKQALDRHKAGEAVVIPVILRPVNWKSALFAHLQALPKDGKPVTVWASRDRAFEDIADGIRRVAEKLRSAQRLA